MSAADGRITPKNVQAVADNITPHALALGLLEEGESIGVYKGTASAGIPWAVVLRTPNRERYTMRPEFLPRTLGTSAREAHATLTATLAALREAARVQKEAQR